MIATPTGLCASWARVCLVEMLEYIYYGLETLFVLWLIRALPLMMRATRRNPVGVEGAHANGFPG